MDAKVTGWGVLKGGYLFRLLKGGYVGFICLGAKVLSSSRDLDRFETVLRLGQLVWLGLCPWVVKEVRSRATQWATRAIAYERRGKSPF